MYGPFIESTDGILYVNTAVLHTRQQCNKVILAILTDLVIKYKDWRFQQLLYNVGIGSVEDLFHEESKKTLEQMLESDTVKRYYKKYENKKAEIINFNEFRSNKR